MKFGENRPQKFQKSELGKFISNFPLKHVITSTNWTVTFQKKFVYFNEISLKMMNKAFYSM